MRRVVPPAALVLGAWVLASPYPSQAAAPLTIEECVRTALATSPKIDEAQAKVRQWEARLAEVESLYYPKLAGLAYIAPMYTVRGDLNQYERRWTSLKDWGPYTHLQATLALPLYSFGRIEAGEKGAAARTEVERARVREVQNTLALEVKKLFYLRLYALSMVPSLRNAKTTLTEAIDKAEESFAQGTGEVTQTDLAKLRYGLSEAEKYLLVATDGAELATAALKHTMGLPADADVQVAGDRLPELPAEADPELAKVLVEAAEHRPEWSQLENGKTATLALEQAEKLANLPVLFLGGSLTADWTPKRSDADNPYWYDPYNQIFGGVALGLMFNLDPANAAAKAQGARALGDEVEALARFAKTGIPLQVKKAHDEVHRFRRMVEISDQGVAATKKWFAFAAAGYVTGTVEARDVLEGLVAYLQARRGYFESLQNYYVARAELEYAMGRT